jgi:nicotinamidase-related amidase
MAQDKKLNNNSKDGTNNQQQKQQQEDTPRYAILVNDMLNDFIHGNLRSERTKDIIPQIRLLLNIAKQRNIPIFYCNDEHLQFDPELRLWGEHAMKGTKGAKVIKELEPSPADYIIPKRTYGSFDGTNLEGLLKSTYNGKGANTLIITGIHTHICVKHTVYGAFIRGYNTIIAEDGVNAFTEKDHRGGLEYIHNNYGASLKKISYIIKDL